MALAEKLIQKLVEQDPEHYAVRVRWLAFIYVLLNVISLALVVTIAWRIQYFITLSQRSNVETLTVIIIFVLAIYYLVSTFRGFIGAVRIILLNAPRLLSGSEDTKERVERRKQEALMPNKADKYVCLDVAVRLLGKPEAEIRWQLEDDAGKLAELVLDGVKITCRSYRGSMNGSIFEFLVNQLEKALGKDGREVDLNITQWSTIDEDQAGQYYSMVRAFTNLEQQLGNKGELWPREEITQEDKEKIGAELRKLVPSLRNEALLPDVEYEVEYNVPVLPEPLGFLKLTRKENRADPVLTMGCAGLVMLALMAVLTFFILLPPWVPAK